MKRRHGISNQAIQPVQGLHVKNYLEDGNLLQLLPTAVYICDANGIILKYNKKAVELWGTRPEPGDTNERFYDSFRLYTSDGTYLPYNQSPVAKCLKDGLPSTELELILERPDQSRIEVSANIASLVDDAGKQVGVITCFHDITNKKETEKQLKIKTNELQDYVNNANIGLHWVDANGIIKWANKAELDMLGYTEEEYIGHHIKEFHANRHKIDDILNKLSCNEILNQYESELLCKDGSVKTVHINSSVYWEEGKFVHTRCFTIDVTEQKNLFHALAQSEKRYRKLIQNLDAPLYTTDVEGRITLYNKAAANLWGREPQIGKDFWCGSYKIFNTDGSNLPLENCPMAVCLKEKRPVYGKEILVVRPDGTLRHVAPHPRPVFNQSGIMTGAINMLIDITDLREAEGALRESEKKYRQLAASLEKKVIEKTQDLLQKSEELKKSEERYHKMIEEVEDYAIILLDKDGTVMNWNKGAQKIKGYTEEEIVGKSFQQFYLPADKEKGLPFELLRAAREKGKTVHEGMRQRKDGSTFWCSVVLTALHDGEGRLIGFSKVTRDLTERKIAEDRMKDYLNQLKFQNNELEQFVYAASHDMKEPLRKIHLYNSFIADHAANKLDERSRDYLSRSVAAVDRMKSLIEDLLMYSRTTVNTDSYEIVNLNKIIDEITLQQNEEIGNTKVSIVADKVPLVRAVAFQMKQLFFNLINNAIKYKHPERDIVIKINYELVNGNNLPWENAEKNKWYHKVSVIDNGIGFEQQYADKIFELFQRLNTLADKKGSGIGLSICKKIIQNHKGYIQATGKPDQGACFSIYIPKH
jgi:PAS domain S-box-containing protein